jgi:hypothetical protein
MREDNGMNTAMNKSLKLSLVSMSISALLWALVLVTVSDESLTDMKIQVSALGILIGLPISLIYSILAVLGAFKKFTPGDNVGGIQNTRTVKVVSVVSLLLSGVPFLGILALFLYALFNLMTG